MAAFRNSSSTLNLGTFISSRALGRCTSVIDCEKQFSSILSSDFVTQWQSLYVLYFGTSCVTRNPLCNLRTFQFPCPQIAGNASSDASTSTTIVNSPSQASTSNVIVNSPQTSTSNVTINSSSQQSTSNVTINLSSQQSTFPLESHTTSGSGSSSVPLRTGTCYIRDIFVLFLQLLCSARITNENEFHTRSSPPFVHQMTSLLATPLTLFQNMASLVNLLHGDKWQNTAT